MGNSPYKATDMIFSKDFDFHHLCNSVHEVETNYHYHDFYEIFFFIQGNVDFIIEGRQYSMQPGNTLLIHYHDLHQAVLKHTEYYERFYIWIDPNYFEKNSTAKTSLDYCFHTFNGRRSRMLATSLEDIRPFLKKFTRLQEEGFGKDILINNFVLELLLFLNKQFISQEEDLTFSNVSENSFIRSVIEHIAANLDQPLTVDSLATTFFVSKGHLSREFKKFTGFTLHNYVLKRKLLYSKTLLMDGKNSNEIYVKCGFSSYPHFIKTFKKEFGITPKAFQMQAKK